MSPRPTSIRLAFLVTLATCVASTACGSTESAPDEIRDEFSGTTLTVEMVLPTARLEYSISCGEVVWEGAFEWVGMGTDIDVPSTVWRTQVELPAGTCAVQLLAFGADDVGVCFEVEVLEVAEDAPTEFYRLFTVCDFEFRIPGGEVVVIAVVPESIEVHEIRYSVFCEGRVDPDFFPETVTLTGSLAVVGQGTGDFGSGSVPTNVWEGPLGDAPVGECSATLSTHDVDGAVLCSVETGFDNVEDVVTRVLAVLPCGT